MPDNRKGFASALHIRGLRQRWMFSAVLPILLLLVLAVFVEAASDSGGCVEWA